MIATDLDLRTYRGDADVAEIVRVFNAASAADGVEEVWNADALRSWLAHASDQFDPARDVVVGELDGRVVAVGRTEWVDTRDGQYREYRVVGTVEPAARGRGVGTALLADLERRAQEIAAGHDHDRETVLASFAPEGRGSEELLRANGFSVVRWYFEMERPTLDDVDVPEMPAGLELRPVTPDQHETIWRANREAFRDHWGGSDESIEQLNRILGDPNTDTSLWLIAWDGDEIAGGVWNDIHPEENETLGLRRGWLGSVFTRRPWRQRGLASALIARSLVLLRERGMTSAALSVDADNPTRALGLYEAAGFAVYDRFVAMRKPMGGPAT